MARTLRQSVTFYGVTPRTVYNALMTSRTHAAITGDKASISKKVGGKFSVYSGYIRGENQELLPDRKIVQTWRAEDWEAGAISRVTFTFKKVKGGTRLTLYQSGIPAKHFNGIKSGWIEYYWEPMKALFAQEAV